MVVVESSLSLKSCFRTASLRRVIGGSLLARARVCVCACACVREGYKTFVSRRMEVGGEGAIDGGGKSGCLHVRLRISKLGVLECQDRSRAARTRNLTRWM